MDSLFIVLPPGCASFCAITNKKKNWCTYKCMTDYAVSLRVFLTRHFWERHPPFTALHVWLEEFSTDYFLASCTLQTLVSPPVPTYFLGCHLACSCHGKASVLYHQAMNPTNQHRGSKMFLEITPPRVQLAIRSFWNEVFMIPYVYFNKFS